MFVETETLKIRNHNGKLICEASRDETEWMITIKNHDCYTVLHLYPNGELQISNFTHRK